MTEPRTVKLKIMKRTVDAEPTPDRGESRVWDTELKGFVLRVYPKGKRSPAGRKVYAVSCRVGRTKRWFTIGEHGSPWTPTTARVKAESVLTDASAGLDQQAAKLERRADLTVNELIDLYLEEGPAAKPSKRAASWAQDRSSLIRHVKPLIGAKIGRDLRPTDVRRMAKAIASGATAADVKTIKRGRAIVRGGPTVAARTVATVSALFTWATTHGGLKLAVNPAKGAAASLSRRPVKERFLSAEESGTLFKTIADMEDEKAISANQADIFRLLMLTGARKTEIAGLSWVEVDLERFRLVLPPGRTKSGEKSGERRIALGAAARAIFAKRRAARSNQPYVFPAYRGDGHVVGLQKPWAAVRLRAGLPGVRLHDLRHSYASFAIADGASLFMVAKALGHASTRVTERYAHMQGDALDLLAEGAALRMGAPTEAAEAGED